MEPPAGIGRRRDRRPQARRVPGDAQRRPRQVRARPVRRLPRRQGGGRRTRQTETFAAMRLEVDNWRWNGVPFYIRAGKAHGRDGDRGAGGVPARAQAGLRRQPLATPRPQQPGTAESARKPGASIWLQSKRPSRQASTRCTWTWTSLRGRRGADSLRTALYGAMLGDRSHFIREDAVEETWRIVQPLIDEAAAGGRYEPARGDRLPRRRCWPTAVAGTSRGFPNDRGEET